MNPSEYIASGAIEAYVMGLADAGDQQLHEQMEASYPEVKAAREAMEMELEKNALQMPAAGDALQQQIKQQLQAEKLLTETTAAKTVQLPPAPKPIRWFRTALAASVLLLMGSILLNFVYWSRFTDYKKRYTALLADQQTLMARTKAMEANMKMLAGPDMKPILLQGTPDHAGMQATVYWAQKTKEVYLVVNNLPTPPKGKQYQLWAQVGNEMVDAGLLEWNGETAVARMKNTPTATAFAISLENEGGSLSPTLSSVMVIGKV
jgi:anti-sigma-K factor RskA